MVERHSDSEQFGRFGTEKTEAIQQLRQAIAHLETWVQTLEQTETTDPQWVQRVIAATQAVVTTELAPPPPPQPTAEEFKDFETFLSEIPSPDAQDEEPAPKVRWWDQVLPSFGKLQTWYDRCLSQVRSWLPPSLGDRFSDWTLTAILSSAIVVLSLGSVYVVQAWKEAPPEKTVVIAPTQPAPTAIAPDPAPETSGPFSPVTPPSPQTEPESSAPEPPIMEEPLPLTPEQQLVASIQDTIDGITNKYSKGLIMGVTADFTGHYLTVAVGPAWYQLRERSQNRLAQDLYEQALTFDFQRLDILDSLGLPVARNPVVGKKMVILRRAIAAEGY